MTAKHTPTPWRVLTPRLSGDHWSMRRIVGADGHEVAALSVNGLNGTRGDENLALIVRAVNAYDDMLVALEDAARFLEMAFDENPFGRHHNDATDALFAARLPRRRNWRITP